MSRRGKSMTTTRKLGVAVLVAVLLPLAGLAAAEDCQEPEPNTAIIEEAPPTRVILGVDCTGPLTISLPDDVLTECEVE